MRAEGHNPRYTGSGAVRKRPRLGRSSWLDAARQALIEEGTAGVEVNKLAKRLRSTRGGFYWFFENRAALLEALLENWVHSSTAAFEEAVRTSPSKGMDEFAAITNLWIEDVNYDPKWDGAVRDWARTSETVCKAVQRVDKKRIGILKRIFENLGYRDQDANVRARILYYHQVGYYAMNVRQSPRERRDLLPYYKKVLAGRGA